MTALDGGPAEEAEVVRPREALPRLSQAEVDTRQQMAFRKVAEKYAWTAQHGGIVLRHNPLKLPPYQDYVFNRISKADYGFRFRDENGRLHYWFPKADDVLALAIEEELDFGFIVAERIAFLPGEPEVTHDEDGCRVLNLWQPPPWKALSDEPEPSPFLDHLKYLLDGDAAACDHVLDFAAHMLQRPQERIAHGLLITSEEKGIGKSTLGAIFRRLVGERNSRVAQTKDLKSQFDGWLVGKLLIQIDEVYEAGNWDLANKLKPLITEPMVSVNVKYGPQLEVENHARFLMFSNHTAPLNIEEGDRRYFVFNSEAAPRSDDYYEALNRYIDTEQGMNAVFSFLMKRDLSTFNAFRRPPMTAAKEAVIGWSGNPLHKYISEAVESGHFARELGREFTFDALQRLLQRDGFGNHAKNVKELSTALDAAGVQKFRKTESGRKHRRYRLPELEQEKPDDDF